MPDIAASVLIASDGTYAFNGWLDEFRISKGIARWTGNFAPPTSAYSAGGLAFIYNNGTIATIAGE
jgi:hypothetical protein